MKKVLLIFTICTIFIAGQVSAETIINRKYSLSGQLTGGNSQAQSIHTDFTFDRNRRWKDQITLKGSFNYGSSAGQDTLLKGATSLRIAYSINEKTYSYTKIEFDHDRFQNIGFRYVATAGYGYWITNADELKIMTEAALGYERDAYLDGTGIDLLILNIIGFFEFERFSDDLNLYFDIENVDDFRFVNELKFKSKIDDHYYLKVSLIDEYSNKPVAGAKNNDVRMTIGFEYNFKKSSI